jgi:hypothetical protein
MKGAQQVPKLKQFNFLWEKTRIVSNRKFNGMNNVITSSLYIQSIDLASEITLISINTYVLLNQLIYYIFCISKQIVNSNVFRFAE